MGRLHWEGRAWQSKELRIASSVMSGRLWAVGVISSCLVPGPGMMESRRNISLVCGHWTKGVVACMREVYFQVSCLLSSGIN